MAGTTVTQHPPAMRVGGRRLSISNARSPVRPRTTSEPLNPGITTHDAPADYPRPAAGGDDAHAHNHHEEEIPKKEKKQGHGNVEKELKMRESAHRKMEENRPRKDMGSAPRKDSARSGRIAQPNKGFGI